jgi:hypothetical protein
MSAQNQLVFSNKYFAKFGLQLRNENDSVLFVYELHGLFDRNVTVGTGQ